jgi:glycosyltransferase involved in cell wall biosynthesis
LACRAPVVATPVALEGIVVGDDDVVVADTSAAIAQAVVDVLNDPDLAQRRADRAAAAMERYRGDKIGERFDAWLRSAVPES